MSGLLWWLGQNAITVALMIPLVLLACRRFRNRPAVQHALWLVVLLKMLTPPVVTWPWSAEELSAKWQRTPTQAETTAIDSTPREGDRTSMPMLPVSEFRGEPVQPDAPDVVPATAEVAPDDSVSLLSLVPPITGGIWLAGAAVCLAWQVRRIARHAALVRGGSVAPQRLTDEVRVVARQLRLRPPRALLAPGILSPFVWCLGRLRLMWPESLAAPADVARSRGVIAHELAHLRRGDHWVAWLELAAGIVWWWNPMFWFVRRRLRETAEMACDALAIGTDPDRRREYAELFLELSAGFKSGAPAPVLAVSAGTPSSFERRLSMILSDRVSGKVSSWGLIAAVCLGLMTLPGWSLGQPKEPPKASSPADDAQLRDLIEKGKFAEAKERLESLRQKQPGGDFSAKWKDILSKELPDACRKGLPKNAAMSWNQCLTCHAKAGDARDSKAPIGIKTNERNFDLLPKSSDSVLDTKRSPVADPNVVVAPIAFKGQRQSYSLVFVSNRAALTATDNASGKIMWESRLAGAVPGRRGEDKWTLDESPDGKLVTLSLNRKDGGANCTFDARTGKVVRHDDVGILPPKGPANVSKTFNQVAESAKGAEIEPRRTPERPGTVWWEKNVTDTLDLAERYLKAIADMKKARGRYDRMIKMGNAISREELDDVRIELERAEAQAKFVTGVFMDAVKSAQAAKAQAEEVVTYSERMVAKGFMSKSELDAARARRDQAASRLKQLESISPK